MIEARRPSDTRYIFFFIASLTWNFYLEKQLVSTWARPSPPWRLSITKGSLLLFLMKTTTSKRLVLSFLRARNALSSVRTAAARQWKIRNTSSSASNVKWAPSVITALSTVKRSRRNSFHPSFCANSSRTAKTNSATRSPTPSSRFLITSTTRAVRRRKTRARSRA